MDLSGPVLLMGDNPPELEAALESEGHRVGSWRRRTAGQTPGFPWPGPGSYATAILRLPRGKEELAMSLHAGASVLSSGGSLMVYGANDEGVRSAAPVMEEILGGVETLTTGARCRVLRGVLEDPPPRLRDSLQAWKILVDPDHPLLPAKWVSYPGVFAHGRLDAGTRVLLDALSALPDGARVLDYGCGSGFVAHVLGRKGGDLELDLLDVDSIALEAAKENVPGCGVILSDGFPASFDNPYDAIVSNPPFHRGKAEDPEMIASFIHSGAARLQAKGSLIFVAQKRLSLDKPLTDEFRTVKVLAEDQIFRVWQATWPKTKRGRK